MQEYIDAVGMDLIITEVGIFVAGFAAVLGIWLERDKTKPPRYAWWLSLLILLATFVGMFQTLADAKEGEEIKADMARMLATLDKIAQNSDVEIPELNEFVKSEVSAQARANPDVVKKVAQRVSDEGGDPAEMLGSYLPPSEVENVGRKGGLKTRVKKDAAPAKDGDKPVEKKSRRKLEFEGKAKPREDKKDAADKKDDDGDKRKRDRDDDKGDRRDRDDKKDKDDKDDKKSDRDDKKDKDDKRGADKKDDKKDDDKKPKVGGPLPGGPGGPKPPTPPPGGPKKPGGR